jgi:hypothetical protein
MSENEFILFSDSSIDRLKLMIRGCQTFALIDHSKESQRIVDNTDDHIKYGNKWCFVLNKDWKIYIKTIDDIRTCISDFMRGYDTRVEEEKEIKIKEQCLKDEIEAWKINRKMKLDQKKELMEENY